jgi:tetratricopeptide (TPR) repeat protein
MSDDLKAAQERFDAGDFKAALELATSGLESAPDDPAWLSLAGRAGVELGSDDAVAQLRRVTELEPSIEAWRDLGDALAAEGDTDGANGAFRKVLELDPNDELALTSLGHFAYQTGDRDDAVSLLSRAAEQGSRASTAAISLVDMYRTLGKPHEALAAAQRVAEAAPGDVIAVLDVAELSLEVGELDNAAAAFDRIRQLDDVPGHDVYPLHGLIAVELRRAQWSAALALASEASALDQHGRSADAVAMLEEKLNGPGEEPAPSPADVQAELDASIADYRRLLAQERNVPSGPLS